MAHSITFDTLAFDSMDGASTKHDVRELELKMQNQFVKVQSQLTLLKWMMGFLLAGIGALILKAFFLTRLRND